MNKPSAEKRREWDNRYKQKFPERVRESKRRWREKHPDKVREINKAYIAANLDKVREYEQHYRNTHKDQKLKWVLRTKYGKAAPEHYQEQHKKQKGKCAICGAPADSRDHRHKPFKLRGWLCRRCNTGLHYLETAAWRAAAEKYLEDWA